jgi:hypothetical protein
MLASGKEQPLLSYRELANSIPVPVEDARMTYGKCSDYSRINSMAGIPRSFI